MAASLLALAWLAACSSRHAGAGDAPVGGDGGGSDGGVEPICDHQDDPAHIDFDIPAITLTGSITVNGATPPPSQQFGTVSLRNGAGDHLILGTVGLPSYSAIQIIPGTYDVYYNWDSTDIDKPVTLPRNSGARLQTGVVLTSSQTFNVEIPVITLAGSITVNGAVPAPDAAFGDIVLRNPGTGDSFTLGHVGSSSFPTKQIVPGTYDIYYTNGGNPVQRGVVLTTSQTFNVDIPMITLSGSITLNGGPAPGAQSGLVALENIDGPASGSAHFRLGSLDSPSYKTQILAGTYDVYYDGYSSSPAASVPQNAHARLQHGIVLTSSQTLDVDIPAVVLSGKVTVNGASPGTNEMFGDIWLRNTATFDGWLLGPIGAAGYTQAIVPGTYDVYYSRNQTAPPALPHNGNALLKIGVVLTSSQVFNIDIPAITLSGKLTLNGALAPLTDQHGEIFLNSATGDDIFITLGQLDDPLYADWRIVPGSYDVYYRWSQLHPVRPVTLPGNQSARLQRNVSLVASRSFDVDVATVTVMGSVTVNGMVTADTRGGLVLTNDSTGDRVIAGNTGQATYGPVLIIRGTYDVDYTWPVASGAATLAAPHNVHHRIGCARLEN